MASILKTDDKFIAVKGDKNVGGCILLRNTYITRGVEEFLSDLSVYEPLTKTQAQQKLHILRYRYNIFVSEWFDLGQLCKAKKTYLRRANELTPESFAQFRMSLKAHKIH